MQSSWRKPSTVSTLASNVNKSTCFIRIDVQNKVQCLGSNANKDDWQVIEKQRQNLARMLLKLKQLQDAASIMGLVSGSEPLVADEGEFDEVSKSVSATDKMGSQ